VVRVLHCAVVKEVGQQQEVEQDKGPEGLDRLGEGMEEVVRELEVDLEVDLEEKERRDRPQTAVLL
jgi:hypothetical protein